MRVLDLFSGIGMFSHGLDRAGGFETIAFCETNPFCIEVLDKNAPGTPVLGNIEELTFEGLTADVITGGFPCQDLSFAGQGAGLAGQRSGLYRELVRAIRVVRPLHAIMENVAALLGRGMGTLLGDMAECGYDAEWDRLSAVEWGSPHHRDRIWITFTDTNKFKREDRRSEIAGRRERVAEETRNANGHGELEPPWGFSNLRGWAFHAACGGAWWADNWEEKFEAFRRMDDGRPTRLDRSLVANAIKGLGNSLHPQIPEIIGRAIMEAAPSPLGGQE